MTDDWKKVRIPLGLLAAVVAVACVTWTYADERYLLASDYRQDRLFDQQMQFMREQRSLDAEVKELEAKQRYAPAQFDNIDRVRLNTKRQQLNQLNKQLEVLDRRKK